MMAEQLMALDFTGIAENPKHQRLINDRKGKPVPGRQEFSNPGQVGKELKNISSASLGGRIGRPV